MIQRVCPTLIENTGTLPALRYLSVVSSSLAPSRARRQRSLTGSPQRCVPDQVKQLGQARPKLRMVNTGGDCYTRDNEHAPWAWVPGRTQRGIMDNVWRSVL